MSFLAGYDKKVTWTPAGGALATFNVIEHSWEDAIEKLDITHSGTAGVQYLLAGILRGKGSFKANLDSTVIITNATYAIIAGQKGVMNFYQFASGANPYIVPGMIISVPFTSSVPGLVAYTANIELSGDAGTYTRPS